MDRLITIIFAITLPALIILALAGLFTNPNVDWEHHEELYETTN